MEQPIYKAVDSESGYFLGKVRLSNGIEQPVDPAKFGGSSVLPLSLIRAKAPNAIILPSDMELKEQREPSKRGYTQQTGVFSFTVDATAEEVVDTINKLLLGYHSDADKFLDYVFPELDEEVIVTDESYAPMLATMDYYIRKGHSLTITKIEAERLDSDAKPSLSAERFFFDWAGKRMSSQNDVVLLPFTRNADNKNVYYAINEPTELNGRTLIELKTAKGEKMAYRVHFTLNTRS